MLKKTKDYRNLVERRLLDLMREQNRVLTNTEIYSFIAERLSLSEEERNLRYKSGVLVYQNMIQFGLLALKAAGYINQVDRGRWIITEKGFRNEINDDYYSFQKKYWKEKYDQKKKYKNKRKNSIRKIDGNEEINENNKSKMLSEILEQNKRILDYLLKK
jgi:restriction endonuclease Mrr